MDFEIELPGVLISEPSFGGVIGKLAVDRAVVLTLLFSTLSSELLLLPRLYEEIAEHAEEILVLGEYAAEARLRPDKLDVRELPERAFLSESLP